MDGQSCAFLVLHEKKKKQVESKGMEVESVQHLAHITGGKSATIND